MSVISLFLFKESGIYIFFKFLVLSMTHKIFSEEKLSQARKKNNKVLAQNLFTQTYRTVWNIKILH